MTNPLIYDIRRVLTSNSVVILMVVMILLSGLLFFSFSSTTQNFQGNFANIQVLSWYDSGSTYHYLAFSWNQFGQPVGGVTFQLNLTTSSQGTLCPSDSSHSVTSIANSSGEAEFSISAPLNVNYDVCFSSTQASGGFPTEYSPYTTPYEVSSSNGIPSGQLIPPGQVVGLQTSEPVQQISNSNNAALENILVNWAGAYGAPPSNYPIYYKFINATENCVTFQNGQECSSSYNSTLFSLLTRQIWRA